MFLPTQSGGGETHVFSGEARQRSSSLKENLDVREGDRGGSCRFQSPSLFLFPNPPALVCGGAAGTAGRCFKRPAAVPFGSFGSSAVLKLAQGKQQNLGRSAQRGVWQAPGAG